MLIRDEEALETQLAEELAAIELSASLAVDERKRAAELMVTIARQVSSFEARCWLQPLTKYAARSSHRRRGQEGKAVTV